LCSKIAQESLHLIENMPLEDLAAHGAAEFALICRPLKLVGATGSPVRPIALVDE